jgi:hypothetical protein
MRNIRAEILSPPEPAGQKEVLRMHSLVRFSERFIILEPKLAVENRLIMNFTIVHPYDWGRPLIQEKKAGRQSGHQGFLFHPGHQELGWICRQLLLPLGAPCPRMR